MRHTKFVSVLPLLRSLPEMSMVPLAVTNTEV